MGCFSYNQLSKNFCLLIASSVYSSQSNPSERLSRFGFPSLFGRWDLFFLRAPTVDSLRVLFSALSVKHQSFILYFTSTWQKHEKLTRVQDNAPCVNIAEALVKFPVCYPFVSFFYCSCQ